MIEVIVDFASFKWSSIYICNLSSLSINIIITRVFAKCSYSEVLKIEEIIIIELMVLEKCKAKIDQKYFI